MPFIETADRTSLFVADWGSGPPAVFTHAWGWRSDQGTCQIPTLAGPAARSPSARTLSGPVHQHLTNDH